LALPEGTEIDILPHALEGAAQERPPIRVSDIETTVLWPHWTNCPDEPKADTRYEARRWIKNRTVKVYYEIEDGRILIVGVSANRRRPA